MDNMCSKVRNYYCNLFVLAILLSTGISKPHSNNNKESNVNNLIRNEGNYGSRNIHNEKHSIRVLPRRDVCAYGNRTYEAGSRFRPDPCTHCHCPRHGGRVHCFIQDCKHMSNCIRYTKRRDKCCGICEEVGCEHTNGRTYRPSEVVELGQCERCECPLTGGKLQCNKVRCPQVACVNPVKRKGDCCETCPNGPNCWLGNLIIPAEPGQRYHTDRCRVCQCPQAPVPFWMRGKSLQAVCESIC